MIDDKFEECNKDDEKETESKEGIFKSINTETNVAVALFTKNKYISEDNEFFPIKNESKEEDEHRYTEAELKKLNLRTEKSLEELLECSSIEYDSSENTEYYSFKSESNTLEENDKKNNDGEDQEQITKVVLYIVDVKLLCFLSSKILKIATNKDKVKFKIKEECKFPIFVRKDAASSLIIKLQVSGLFGNSTLETIITNNITGCYLISGLALKIYKDDEIDFPGNFDKEVATGKDYFKMLIREEGKNVPLYKKLIQFMSFGSYRWSLPSGIVYVKDLRTGDVIKEKMPKTLRVYLTYFYTKTLSESKFYKNIMKKMTLRCAAKFNSEHSKKSIPKFVKYFNINLEEIKKDLNEFRNFNEFFYRELKPGARSIENINAIASPADCRIMVFRSVEDAKQLWIKGKKFTVLNFLRKEINIKSMFVCRLAPQDYHRFHSPVNGIIKSITYVNGQYLTVHPISVNRTNVFTENIRVIIQIESEEYGRLYYVPIGAALVGSIIVKRRVNEKIKTMDEIGYFRFGGSTVLCLFTKSLRFNNTILNNTLMGIETLVKVGDYVADRNIY